MRDKNVMVYRLIAADTIEEKVLPLRERKVNLFNSTTRFPWIGY